MAQKQMTILRSMLKLIEQHMLCILEANVLQNMFKVVYQANRG